LPAFNLPNLLRGLGEADPAHGSHIYRFDGDSA
jgi:hypothetical protein